MKKLRGDDVESCNNMPLSRFLLLMLNVLVGVGCARRLLDGLEGTTKGNRAGW